MTNIKPTYLFIKIILGMVLSLFLGLLSFIFEWRVVVVESANLLTFMGIIFSIFMGLLLALAGFQSDTSYLTSEKDLKIFWIKSKLHLSYSSLFSSYFYVYLITICLVFVVAIINAIEACKFYWIFDLFVCFASFSVFITFTLPSMMVRIQQYRLSGEAEERKKNR